MGELWEGEIRAARHRLHPSEGVGGTGHLAEAVAISPAEGCPVPPAAAFHGRLSSRALVIQHHFPWEPEDGQPSLRLGSSGKALEKLKKPRWVGSCFAVLSMIHECGLCGICFLDCFEGGAS